MENLERAYMRCFLLNLTKTIKMLSKTKLMHLLAMQ